MRSLLLSLSLGSLLLACGPPISIVDPNDPTTDRGALPGDRCDDDDPCLKGLRCVAGICDTLFCGQASNPTQWCARSLDLNPDQVFCSGRACEPIALAKGSVCASTIECLDGLSCVQNLCQITCDVDLDCAVGTPACRSFEDADGQPSKVCVSANLGCSQEPSPDAYCVERLRTEPGKAACVEDVCTRLSLANAGAACSDDTDCTESVCSAGICARGCFSSSSCGQGFVCLPSVDSNHSVCRRECLGDAQCPSGTACRADPTTGRKACVEAPLACNNFPDLEADAYCDSLFRDDSAWGALCDRDKNECLPLPPDHHWIYVLDVSQEFSLCQRTFPDTMWRAPGTDLTFVGSFPDVSNLSVDAKRGVLVRSVPDPKNPLSPNDFNDPETLDVPLASLDENLCPSNLNIQRPDWMYSLGCGAGALFRLITNEGLPASLLPEETLVVGAYGPTCSGEDPQTQFADRFLVFRCNRPDGYLTPFESCVQLTRRPVFDTQMIPNDRE